MKKRFLKITAIFMLAMAQLVSWAQVERGLHLGSLELVYSREMIPITRTIDISFSRFENEIPQNFINKVGGVAFVQVAEPDMKIRTLQLGCDQKKNIAYVKINGVTYPIPLPVWQLKSIVDFAYGSYGANNSSVVSILGVNSGLEPIVFHPSFTNNLLGMRLLQVDLLLIEPDAVAELPTDETDEYVVANSEKERIIEFKTQKQDRLVSFERLNRYYQTNFSTYIFTDFKQAISFKIENGEIKFKGRPYYRFYSMDENGKYNFEQAPTDSLRERLDEVYAMNPIVMDAALNTCQWVAFFRYVKDHYSKEWTNFCMDEMKKLQFDAPKVTTPIDYIHLEYLEFFKSTFDSIREICIQDMSEIERRYADGVYNLVMLNDSLEGKKVRPRDCWSVEKQYEEIGVFFGDLESDLRLYTKKLQAVIQWLERIEKDIYKKSRPSETVSVLKFRDELKKSMELQENTAAYLKDWIEKKREECNSKAEQYRINNKKGRNKF